MASPISDIVDVQISIQDQAVTQAGFGIPLILGPNAVFAERVREYGSLVDVAVDFAVTDAEFLASQAVFAQTPSPRTLKIGRQIASVAEVQTLDFDADFVTGNTIDIDVQGTAIVQVPFNTDQATTLADLATELQAQASIVTATGTAARQITITSAVPGVPVTLSNILVAGGATQAVGTTTITVANVGPVDDLVAVTAEDDDWYALVYVDRTASLVEVVADYIQTVRKIFITASSDTNILDDTITTDIASLLSAKSLDRTAVMFNADPTNFIDAAWLGRCLPEDPGSITWMFKTLAGIIADDLTGDELSDALGKNANVYVTRGGIDMTQNGTMASGRFIDIRRGVDWLQARLEENIFNRLASLNKIPFTNAGIAVIENEIRGVLENAIGNNVIVEDPDTFGGLPYLVTLPDVSDVSAIDKANRLLPDVTFNATLSGAIHRVEVNGVVSV